MTSLSQPQACSCLGCSKHACILPNPQLPCRQLMQLFSEAFPSHLGHPSVKAKQVELTHKKRNATSVLEFNPHGLRQERGLGGGHKGKKLGQ